MDVLTLHNLHKAFGTQKVLQGVGLNVPQHSIFGFIGKNGAGKTTTMKLILGLENWMKESCMSCRSRWYSGKQKQTAISAM